MITNKHKKTLITLLVLSSISLSSYARTVLSDYQTTRTLSLGGAGIASLLINESTLLNPASIVFFNDSSLYYQKGSKDVSGVSKSGNEAIIISDTSSGLKGGLSYTYQNFNGDKRIRYSSSVASNLGGKSSLGFTYRYTADDIEATKSVYHQAVIGFTHLPQENLILGITITDPFYANKDDFKFTLGAQYTLTKNLSFILDLGSGDQSNPSEESFTKWALQLMSFEQLFFRYGNFHDKHTDQRGNAWGISWVGPKLAIDYGYKSSEFLDDFSPNLLNGDKIIENSISMTVIF